MFTAPCQSELVSADVQGPGRAAAPGRRQARGLPVARGTCLASVPAPAPRCCGVKVLGQGSGTSSPRYARHTVRPFPAYDSRAFSVRSGVNLAPQYGHHPRKKKPRAGGRHSLDRASPWPLLSPVSSKAVPTLDTACQRKHTARGLLRTGSFPSASRFQGSPGASTS